jgi:hypothetical protein
VNCAQAAAYLPAPADEVDDATAAALAEHVAGCAACGAEAARYSCIREALVAAGAREAEPPPDMVAAILAATTEHPRRRALPMAALPPIELVRAIQDNREVIVGAAGAVAVAAGAAWVVWRGLRALTRARPEAQRA